MSEVVAIATAIIGAMAGVIVKLYRDRGDLQTRFDAERARADALQEKLHRDHKRDLKRVAGLPTSIDPPPPPVERIEIRGLPGPLVRDETPKPPRPRKKPRN